MLQDFEAVTRAEDDTELNLSDAAAESRYSSDDLRRLHRLGKLPAYRKRRNLFFRSGDLPRKPAAPKFSSYDPVADARRVISECHEEQQPRTREGSRKGFQLNAGTHSSLDSSSGGRQPRLLHCAHQEEGAPIRPLGEVPTDSCLSIEIGVGNIFSSVHC